MTYPFNCKDTFLIALEMSRKPDIPVGSKLQLEAQFKVIMDNYPDQFQVNIRLKSTEQSPIKFKTELVGLFGHNGSDPERDKLLINSYLNDSGIPIIWPTFLPVLRMVAAAMGVNGVNLPLIAPFNIELIEQETKPAIKAIEKE